jgi:hypothetical protein
MIVFFTKESCNLYDSDNFEVTLRAEYGYPKDLQTPTAKEYIRPYSSQPVRYGRMLLSTKTVR